MSGEHFRLFTDDVLEVSIHDLVNRNGARVNPSWFGSSRKKDLVVVATLFGIVGRALRRKNVDEDKFCRSSEFKAIRQGLNSLQIENMAGSNDLPAILPETPPSTPEEFGHNIANAVAIRIEKTTREALQNVEKTTGPRLKVKRAGNQIFAKFLKSLTSTNKKIWGKKV